MRIGRVHRLAIKPRAPRKFAVDNALWIKVRQGLESGFIRINVLFCIIKCNRPNQNDSEIKYKKIYAFDIDQQRKYKVILIYLWLSDF